jgi:hypothetical protein
VEVGVGEEELFLLSFECLDRGKNWKIERDVIELPQD